MLTIAASIGPKALYLLFLWLLSAAAASWMSERKGYGERVGLTFGLILSAVGLLIVLLLPGRPGSRWREEGWVPPRVRRRLRWRRQRAIAAGPPSSDEEKPA